MPRLMIVLASTRPGRVGEPVAQWIRQRADADGRFDVDFVDLAELSLPFMDEPNHPRYHRYTHQHTKDWSARVKAADELCFVVPEYNFGFTATIKNAIDYLNQEWAYKPLGLVSYGGISAGTRGAQMLKQVVTTLKMVPLTEAVQIPFVAQFIDDEGRFQPNEILEQAASAMFDELVAMEEALRPLRERHRAS